MTKMTTLLGEPRTKVMGIVNLSSDSFCPTGCVPEIDQAVDYAMAMVDAGADIIDVGAEATNPTKSRLDVLEDDEIRRLQQFVTKLATRSDVPISVDTSRAAVMRMLPDWGAALINDVRALRRPGCLEAARDSGLHVCLMHMAHPDGLPSSPAVSRENVVTRVTRFLTARVAACIDAGFSANRLIIDPGIGGGSFGKNPSEDFEIVRRCDEICRLDLPVLVGLSRKSFIGLTFDLGVEERLIPSVVLGLEAARKGASILRVHDVFETVTALSCLRETSSKKG